MKIPTEEIIEKMCDRMVFPKKFSMSRISDHIDVQLCSRAIGGNTNRSRNIPKMCSGWSGSQLFLNLDQLHLTEQFNELYQKVSEHDRMIVDRMARKRTEELAMVEESQIARRYWEEERRARQQVMLEQNEMLTRILKERRDQDAHDTMVRLENLRNRDRFLTQRLREELNAKENLVDMRLQKLNYMREHQTNERRQMQMEKMRLIAQNNDESFLDQKYQQQLIIEHLQDKVNRAEYQRMRYLQVQKARVQQDNEMEERLHRAKLSENQRFEAYQKQKLMDTIRRSDQKTRMVLEGKRRELEESRSQARNSALLRDFVRRSFTPEVNSFSGGNLFSTRSFKSV